MSRYRITSSGEGTDRKGGAMVVGAIDLPWMSLSRGAPKLLFERSSRPNPGELTDREAAKAWDDYRPEPHDQRGQ